MCGMHAKTCSSERIPGSRVRQDIQRTLLVSCHDAVLESLRHLICVPTASGRTGVMGVEKFEVLKRWAPIGIYECRHSSPHMPHHPHPLVEFCNNSLHSFILVDLLHTDYWLKEKLRRRSFLSLCN